MSQFRSAEKKLQTAGRARTWSSEPAKQIEQSVTEGPKSMAEAREVMNIRQASAYLGVSPDTLYKYVSEERIPAFKLGNRWRFKKSKLDEWMEEQSSVSMGKRAPSGSSSSAGAASAAGSKKKATSLRAAAAR